MAPETNAADGRTVGPEPRPLDSAELLDVNPIAATHGVGNMRRVRRLCDPQRPTRSWTALFCEEAEVVAGIRSIVPAGRIDAAILLIREQKVLLDRDLAKLYGVTTKALNQAVKRNLERFPEDFMFRLTWAEVLDLRSQSVTLNAGPRSQTVTLKRGRNVKYLPYAFTQEGVAMLSSVLKSQRAVRVNVEIMRAFVRLRRALAVNAELARRLDELEKRVGAHDEHFVAVIQAIRELMDPPPAPKKSRIGFRPHDAD